MQIPQRSTGPGLLLALALYIIGRLVARPDTKHLAGEIKPQREKLKAKQQALNEARDNEILAQAALDEVLFRLFDGLGTLQLEVTTAVNRRYEDPLYKAVFELGVPELRAEEPKTLQEKHLPRMISVLSELPAAHALRKHVEPLTKFTQELPGAIKVLTDAQLKTSLAETALGTAVEALLDAWSSVHGSLEKLFPRQRALVDSFFPAVSTKRRNGKTDPEEPPEEIVVPADPGKPTK